MVGPRDASPNIVSWLSPHEFHHCEKQHGDQSTSLSDTRLDAEKICSARFGLNAAWRLKIKINIFKYVEEWLLYAIQPQDVPKGVAVDTIECFGEVDKINRWLVSICNALFDVSEDKDLVAAWSSSMKTSLFFSESFVEGHSESTKQAATEQLPRDRQECKTSLPIWAVL